MINLEKPYSDDYKAGYLVTNSENRRIVILIDFNNKKTSTAYARYLLSVKLGRYLNVEEQVDHIDGDKTNDTIENFQILSIGDNNRKSKIETNTTLKMVEMICPMCKSLFIRRHGNSHLGKKGKFSACSRNCLHLYLKNGYSERELKIIGENQIVRIFRQ